MADEFRKFLKQFLVNQGGRVGKDISEEYIKAALEMASGSRSCIFQYDASWFLEVSIAVGVIADQHFDEFSQRMEGYVFARRIEVREGTIFLFFDMQLTGIEDMDTEFLDMRIRRTEEEIAYIDHELAATVGGKNFIEVDFTTSRVSEVVGHA